MIAYTLEQRAAIERPIDAPLTIVAAGPGSGKTSVLVGRVAYLISNGVRTDAICVVTFTNQAAREMAERLAELIGPETRVGYIGTIHGLCLRLLQRFGAVVGYNGGSVAVVDEEQSAIILRDLARLTGHGKLPVSRLLGARDGYGTNARRARPLTKEATVVAHYYRHLQVRRAIDFRGLLSLGEDLLRKLTPREHGFTHLMVDECQDTSFDDWGVFVALRAFSAFYVGDADQAIYGFRGGRVESMVALADAHPDTVIRLETNWRCGEAICEGAQRLIERNKCRVAKQIVSADGAEPDCVEVCGCDSAVSENIRILESVTAYIRHGSKPFELAVLARTNAIADDIRHFLQAASVPVEANIILDEVPGWKYARVVLDFLAAPDSEWAVENLIEARGGNKALCDLRRQAALNRTSAAELYFRGSPWLNSLREFSLGELPATLARFGCEPTAIEAAVELVARHRAPGDQASLTDILVDLRWERARERRGNGVAVLTMHSAKGREWPVVFLAGLEQEVIPGRVKDADMEEERRLFFVALTRAKRTVHCSYARQRAQPFAPRQMVAHTPSQFIAEALGASCYG